MASSPETAPSSEANSSSLNGSHPFPPPPIAATNLAPPPSSSPTQTSSSSTPSAPFKNSSSPPKHPAKASSVPAPLIDQKNGDSRKSSGAGFHIKLPVTEGDILSMIAFFVLFIGSVICVISCCLKKNKKKKKKKKDAAPHNSMSYYSDSGSEKWQNRGSAGPNKMMGHPQATAWHAPPPPPSLHSTELSMDYSGPHGPALPPPSPAIALGFIKSTFSYEQLASATNGFSPENLLGQGGFGYVYKGVLPNGKEIAVKQLKAGSGQGEREFQAEVEIISRVHHRHLVSLVGYCISGSQRLLVYDFVPNKTLEFHLHGNNRLTMEWPTRMKIALGSAKGLAYLHEDCHPRIIHRDIKTSNILLDNKFEAMVADFGLAKLSSDNYTHVSTRVMGTFGYLAPEYASSGKLTEKSDVFSFGVMLLELITGKRPVDSNPMEDSLVDWARPLLALPITEESYDELVDSRLEGNFSKVEMARMVACAAASIRHSAKRRPKMSQIVRALEGDSSLDDLNEGLKPGQSMLFTSSSDYDSGSYASNMRRIAFEGIDFNLSGQTSEYGLNPSASSSSGEMMDASSRSRRVGRKH